MKSSKATLVAIVLAALALGALAACEKKGPMERAGERVDDAVEKVGEDIEDAGDHIRDKMDH